MRFYPPGASAASVCVVPACASVRGGRQSPCTAAPRFLHFTRLSDCKNILCPDALIYFTPWHFGIAFDIDVSRDNSDDWWLGKICSTRLLSVSLMRLNTKG